MERYRLHGTLLIALSFLIGSFGSMMLSGFSLLDNSPTSYIIVVMMMSILFVVFTLKDRRSIGASRDSMLMGLAVFAAYILMLALLRVSLSWIFLTYRIDALLLPLLLLSLVVAVFGIDGIKVFWPVAAYVALASPIILLPVFRLNGALAGGSAAIVYAIVKAFGVNVSLSGLAITAPAGASITIAETCVPIGTFIAFVMFLIPVAYLYDGRIIRKAMWVLSGVALLFALNIARMSIISFAWTHYGIDGAISGFHSVSGGIIFYFAIAAMLLLCGKYRMRLSRHGRNKRRAKSRSGLTVSPGILALCILIGVTAFLLSFPYHGSVVADPVGFGAGGAAPPAHLGSWVESVLGSPNSNVMYLGSMDGGSLFGIGSNASATPIYALVSTANYPDAGVNLLNFTAISRHAGIYRGGIAVHSIVALSNRSAFNVEYFSVPYSFGNSSESVNIELFSRLASEPGRCARQPNGIALYVNGFESLIYNILSGGSPSGGGLCIGLPA